MGTKQTSTNQLPLGAGLAEVAGFGASDSVLNHPN